MMTRMFGFFRTGGGVQAPANSTGPVPVGRNPGRAQERAGGQPLQKYPAAYFFIVLHCVRLPCSVLRYRQALKVVVKLPTLAVTVNVPAMLLAVSVGAVA